MTRGRKRERESMSPTSVLGPLRTFSYCGKYKKIFNALESDSIHFKLDSRLFISPKHVTSSQSQIVANRELAKPWHQYVKVIMALFHFGPASTALDNLRELIPGGQ